jgi:hypothetical protein
MSGRNSMAKAALEVLRAIYVRFKKAVNSSRTKAGPRSPTILDMNSKKIKMKSKYQSLRLQVMLKRKMSQR